MSPEQFADHRPDRAQLTTRDNALAESVNSSYKTELIDHQPLYPGATELSLATAEWVAFYNRQRPNGYCQDLTPDRAEALYYHRQRHPHTEEALK